MTVFSHNLRFSDRGYYNEPNCFMKKCVHIAMKNVYEKQKRHIQIIQREKMNGKISVNAILCLCKTTWNSKIEWWNIWQNDRCFFFDWRLVQSLVHGVFGGGTAPLKAFCMVTSQLKKVPVPPQQPACFHRFQFRGPASEIPAQWWRWQALAQ